MTLSHLDEQGKARMVDVGGKEPMRRTARARGKIRLSPRTLELIRENQLKKGDALSVAQIAGIQAAKRTAELIPLCHPLALEQIQVWLEEQEDGVVAFAEVRCEGKTGVEMEALTAVSVALLTVYDMCKAVDKQMRLEEVVLLEKIKEPLDRVT